MTATLGDADALLVRYLANHGRTETQVHRGNGMTREVVVVTYCPCAICTAALAHLIPAP